jgi:hypothetical protein
MSRGKYSPNLPNLGEDSFVFNADGQVPAPWKGGDEYDQRTMFAQYDSEGFDRYGYSAFDADGTFVGTGNGVDRNGYTEYEYLTMSDEQWFNL